MATLRNMTASHTYLINGVHFEPGSNLQVDLGTVPEWCGVWRGLRTGCVVNLDEPASAEPVTVEPVREYAVKGRRNRRG